MNEICPNICGHLQQVNRMHQQLVPQSPDAIILLNEGKLLYVNGTGIRLFGAKCVSELLNHSISEFILEDSDARTLESVDKIQNQGANVEPFILTLRKRDGTSFAASIAATTVSHHNYRIVLATIRDVSNVMVLPELQSVNREWEVFRLLVAHLADQTLNPLTVLKGFLQLRKEGEDVSPELLLNEVDSISKAWENIIRLLQVAYNSGTSPLRLFVEEKFNLK